jgi:hypothetical protein
MGDFSRSPRELLAESLKKGYIGLHVEQGVPVLDRDLNLLHDLVAALTRALATRYIGNGIAAGQGGFQIVPTGTDNDFQILAGPSGPGICLVDGIEVVIKGPITYSSQKLAALTTPGPPPGDPRTDVVFLEAWLAEVDSDQEEELLNDDLGIQTSVRLQPAWAVRVAEGVDPPELDPGHVLYPLAELTRPRGNPKITASMITDLRQQRLTLTDLEKRVQEIEELRLMPQFDVSSPFAPPLGGPGTQVTLSGRNFDIGDPQVRFGTVTATSVKVLSMTSMTATVPDGLRPGPASITVANRAGTAVSGREFRVLGSRPEIAAFNPAKGKPETSTSPATKVTITGRHFDENIDGTTTVSFGTELAEIESISATEIVTHVPLIESGDVFITVATDSGHTSSATKFSVRVPA